MKVAKKTLTLVENWLIFLVALTASLILSAPPGSEAQPPANQAASVATR